MKQFYLLLLTFNYLALNTFATSTSFTMAKADYQTIVDDANTKGVNTAQYSDNTDNYYGASAYYSNFDIADDGSYNNTVFSSWKEAVQTGISAVLLPTKNANSAQLNDTISVYFMAYNGSTSANDFFTFICTKAAPSPTYQLYISANGSTKAEILTFSIGNSVTDADINAETKTISITMAPGTDLTALTPTITISENATIDPASTPPINFSYPVTFTVTAEDATVKKTWTVTVLVMEETFTAIKEMQYVADPTTDDASPLTGQTIITKGVVTGFASFSSYNKYYIQDGDGPWNGIYVYDNKTGIVLSLGDSVKLTGTVDEYFNVTEIVATDIEIISGRNPQPTPHILTKAIDESLEGALVTLQGVSLSTDTDSGDDKAFLIAKMGQTEFKIFDELFDAIEPSENTNYSITGVVAYTYNHYRICPPNASSINVIASAKADKKPEITLWPNPANERINISGATNKQVKIWDITGQLVAVKILYQNQITVSDLTKGLYLIKIDNTIKRLVKQ